VTIVELTRLIDWSRLATIDGAPVVYVNDGAFVYYASFTGVFYTEDDGVWTEGAAIATVEYVSAVFVDVTTRLAKAASRAALAEGEFFWDDATKLLYVWLAGGDPPDAHQLTIGRLQGFTDRDVVYIDDLLYLPLVVAVPNITVKQDLSGYDKPAFISGTVELNNVGGDLDYLVDESVFGNDLSVANLDDADVVEGNASRADLQYLGAFYVEEPALGLRSVRLGVKDLRAAENVSVPGATFNQTDYPDLEDDRVGDPIRLIYGAVREAIAIPLSGGLSSGAVDYKVAQEMTDLGDVYTLQDDVWTAVVPTASDDAAGEFTLAEADARNASGGLYECKVVDCVGIAVTYAPDVIKDLFSRLRGIEYDASAYDTDEWEAEEVRLATIGVVFDEETTLFAAIQKVQNGASAGFRFEFLSDGRRTIRVDDWRRMEIAAAENVVFEDLLQLRVEMNADLLAAVFDVGYQRSWQSGKSRHLVDESAADQVLQKYRQRPRRAVETLLTSEPDAQLRADYEVERFATVHGTCRVGLMGAEYMALRIYDMLVAEIGAAVFDRDYGTAEGARPLFGVQRCQVVGLLPDYRQRIMRVDLLLIEPRGSYARALYFSFEAMTLTGPVRDDSGAGNDGTRVGFGPVARYPLTTDQLDASGNGNHLTLPGGTSNPTFSDAGAQFDGSDDFITLPAAVYGAVDDSQSWSLTARVKLDTLTPAETNGRVFEFKDTISGGYVTLMYNNGNTQWLFSLHDGTYSRSASSGPGSATVDLVDLVVTYDAVTKKMWLYVDGSPVQSNTYDYDPFNPNTGYLGGQGGAANFDGLIKEARVYNHCLSAEEAAAQHARHMSAYEVVAFGSGTGLHFNNSRVTLPAALAAQIGTTKRFSFGVAVRSDSTQPETNPRLIQFANGAKFIRFYWSSVNDYIVFQVYDGTTNKMKATKVLSHATAYRVMATYDGVGGMALYMDGDEVGQQTYTGAAFDCTAGVVGGDGGTADFLGALDDVTVFLRELSPADAKLWTRGGEVA